MIIINNGWLLQSIQITPLFLPMEPTEVQEAAQTLAELRGTEGLQKEPLADERRHSHVGLRRLLPHGAALQAVLPDHGPRGRRHEEGLLEGGPKRHERYSLGHQKSTCTGNTKSSSKEKPTQSSTGPSSRSKTGSRCMPANPRSCSTRLTTKARNHWSVGAS